MRHRVGVNKSKIWWLNSLLISVFNKHRDPSAWLLTKVATASPECSEWDISKTIHSCLAAQTAWDYGTKKNWGSWCLDFAFIGRWSVIIRYLSPHADDAKMKQKLCICGPPLPSPFCLPPPTPSPCPHHHTHIFISASCACVSWYFTVYICWKKKTKKRRREGI